MFPKLSKRTKIWSAIAGALVFAVILTLILYFTLSKDEEKDQDKDPDKKPKGSVVTNGHECAKIGGSVLEKGGSAVDAAIAALFCEGVAMPAACGLGGGFLMTLYIKETGEVQFLNARETAPALATQDMFPDQQTAQKSPLSIAVPGELKGYWALHQRYGKLQWKDLIEPTIELCLNGIYVTKYLEGMMADKLELLHSNEALKETFIDPITNLTYKEGDRIRRPRLAKTLRIIAEEGGDALYTGSLVKNFVDDIKGGIIQVSDMNNYSPKWEDPFKTKLPSGETLYTAPLPGSGVVLGFILNLLNGMLTKDQSLVTNWQRIVESFKFGYGKRTHLGDSEAITGIINNMTSEEHIQDIRTLIKDDKTFYDPTYYGADYLQPEDHGTAHVSVLAPNGDAVSVTSTINLVFGSGIMSPSTGIIFNDQMDDFSSPNIENSFGVPPSPANFIQPGKRPLSSMSPSIILDENNNVKMVIGAAGGTKITTSVAVVILKHLFWDQDLQQAMDEHRMHHQLMPMLIEMENDYVKEPEIVKGLEEIGHNITFTKPNGFSAVTSISNKNGVLRGSSDFRRTGSVYYIY